MNKKILVILVLCSLAGIFFAIKYYLDSSTPEAESQNATDQSVPTKVTEAELKADSNSAAAPPSANNEQLPVDDPQNPDQEKKLDDTDKEKYQTYFQETEKNWESRVEEFFTKESGLGKEKFETYQRMREGFEKDKMEAFQEHHEFMKAQYGANYTYRPSSDEQSFAKEVSKKYEQALKDLIGEDHHQRFKDMRSEFNDRLKKDTDPEIGHMVMEF
jgi:hypothetical protein